MAARHDRAVLVTGAAGGMGRACARALAGDGALILQDLEESALDALVGELESRGVTARAVCGDLCDAAHVEALAKAVGEGGGLRALAHTAGVSPNMADARRVFEVDLVASARLLDALTPQLSPGSAGVLIASQAGHMLAGACTPEIDAILDDPTAPAAFERLVDCAGELAANAGGAYGLAKRGVQRLAVNRAAAWGAAGARLVSLSPGLIDTPMGRLEHADSSGGATDQILQRTAVEGRMGRAEEIASVVAFLCSEGASYVSGVDWLVDGGSTWQVLGAP